MHKRKATLGIIFLIVFIDLVGFGIVIPFLPLYVEAYGPSPVVFGLLMASFSVMQFVFAPILGRLSDRYGRRPVLLVSLAGSVVGYLLFAFAGSITMLFASRIIDGISGGNISTAQAVIADVTDERDRARGMGLIGAAFGLGFICGPGLGGLLADIALWLPGVAAAATSTVALVLVAVLLPETLPDDARRTARHRPMGLHSLADALSHRSVGLCLAIIFCIIFAFSNFETTFAQFGRLRFQLSTTHIGWLFVYAGVLGAVIQGGLTGVLARRFGEGWLVAVGTFLSFLSLGVLPYVSDTGALLATLAVVAVGHGLAAPSLSSLTSKLVTPDEVGGVMGVYQSMSSLGRIVGPFWGELVYGAISFEWPYRTGSLFMLAAAAMAVVLLARTGVTPPQGTEPGIPER